jgi:DNA-binding GntR family transcriptional regulator
MPGNGIPGGGITVTRSTLRQQIVDALRDEVLAGRLSPGQEFTVKEIAEQFGVSATPIREALVDLAGQGLLDSVQHRGFRVHEFSVDDYRKMIDARSFIAEGIFRRVAEEGGMRPVPDPAMLLSLRRRAEEAERAARAGDLDILIAYDIRFWREVGMLIDNAYVSELLHQLRVHAWVFAVPYLRREPDLKGRLWAGHRVLAEALGRRDADAAHRLVVEYNRHAWALIETLADE